MPRIRCHYLECVFLDEGFCSAAAVEIDPDKGCITFSPAAGLEDEDEWDEEKDLDEWDEIEEEEDDDDEDLWLDEEEEY